MGAILFDESMGLLLRWANAVRPYRKGVVAGVKCVCMEFGKVLGKSMGNRTAFHTLY